jgi:hypothetical protein
VEHRWSDDDADYLMQKGKPVCNIDNPDRLLYALQESFDFTVTSNGDGTIFTGIPGDYVMYDPDSKHIWMYTKDFFKLHLVDTKDKPAKPPTPVAISVFDSAQSISEVIGQLVGLCSTTRFWDQLPDDYPMGAGVFQDQLGASLVDAALARLDQLPGKPPK